MHTLPPKIRNELEEHLNRHRITGEKREKLIETVKILYKKTIYDPEEAVGVIAAQSLSEPATQMTMRTYHFAGTAGIQVTLGLPRILEIFDARKEPRTPAMEVNIRSECQSLEKVRKIAENIKEVNVKDIMLSTVTDLTDLWIKCKLDLRKLKGLEILPEKLPKIIKIRNANVKLENNDILVISPKKRDIKNMHKLKYSFLETHIKGIKGISQVVVTKQETSVNGKTSEEWVINTLGSNLKKVFEIEGVDSQRTTCNNIFEIYDTLGIDAARNAIINQVQYTMEEQGLGVDIRYIMLLADLMTVDGQIKAIGRYGISGQKASVLVRASFEETKKHLTTASIKGEKDLLSGAIENIMLNQVVPIGTGTFRLIGHIPEGRARKAKKKQKPKKGKIQKNYEKMKAPSKPKKKTKKK